MSHVLIYPVPQCSIKRRACLVSSQARVLILRSGLHPRMQYTWTHSRLVRTESPYPVLTYELIAVCVVGPHSDQQPLVSSTAEECNSLRDSIGVVVR